MSVSELKDLEKIPQSHFNKFVSLGLLDQSVLEQRKGREKEKQQQATATKKKVQVQLPASASTLTHEVVQQ
jgi:hypothetical protein